MTLRVAQRWIAVWGLSLLLSASGCINELVVDIEQRATPSPDGGIVDEKDATPEEDASAPAPVEAGPVSDAGNPVLDAGGKPDTGVDTPPPDSAVLDAGRPDAAPPDASEAGPPDAAPPADAGCKGPTCEDASFPTTVPCPGGCGVMATGLVGNKCPNGAPETCWTTSSGICELQCPPVKSCTAQAGCASDEYCYFPYNDCGAGSTGHCAKRPKTCPTFDITACGCNGMKYLNGCVATQVGGTDVADPLHAMCK